MTSQSDASCSVVDLRISRRWILGASLLVVAASLAACVGTGGPVSVYMRNDTAEDAIFTIRPLADPLLSFGIPAGEVGGACVVAPDGWEIVRVPDGRAPDDVADLPTLQRPPLRLGGTEAEHQIIWAWIDSNGLVRSGVGNPVWWVGERQEACAA